MKQFVIALGLVICLAACAGEPGKVKEGADAKDNEAEQISRSEVLMGNLQSPWAINKLGETFYISEREGTIAKVEGGHLTRQRVELTEPLSSAAEAGLLGFVLAPDFAVSQEAFAYYTYEGDDGRFNRIVVLQLEGNEWQEVRLLIDGIPSGNVHHGGRLEIGPDGKLYATAGDAAEPEIAQNLASLGGKILRLNLDGTIPADNPMPNSYVYSYGHRNPQGLVWTPDGQLYATEHGPSANDEVNKIEPGVNFGWPVIVGEQQQDGMKTPLFTSGSNETWAPSGMAFYEGELYVATLRGTAILAINIESGKVREVVNVFGRIRDVWIEEDTLYWITNNTDGRGNPAADDDRLMRMLIGEK